MLDEIGVESSHLSQHLQVLRRYSLVTSTRSGNSVHYRLANEEVAELLKVARNLLFAVMSGQKQMNYALNKLPPIGEREKI